MAKEPMEIAHTDSLSDSDQLEVELAALPTNGKVFVLLFLLLLKLGFCFHSKRN